MLVDSELEIEDQVEEKYGLPKSSFKIYRLEKIYFIVLSVAHEYSSINSKEMPEYLKACGCPVEKFNYLCELGRPPESTILPYCTEPHREVDFKGLAPEKMMHPEEFVLSLSAEQKKVVLKNMQSYVDMFLGNISNNNGY